MATISVASFSPEAFSSTHTSAPFVTALTGDVYSRADVKAIHPLHQFFVGHNDTPSLPLKLAVVMPNRGRQCSSQRSQKNTHASVKLKILSQHEPRAPSADVVLDTWGIPQNY
jgi:hypothetical protein